MGLKSGRQLLSLKSSSSGLHLPDPQQNFYPQFLNREQHHVNKYGMNPRVLDNMCKGSYLDSGPIVDGAEVCPALIGYQ